jgi:GT2 family glycosyltransferase
MTSRRRARDWALPVSAARPAGLDPAVDVLIPTAGRPAELAVTLAGLAAQDDPAFRVVVSDQSDDEEPLASPAVQAMVRVLAAQGRPVELIRRRRRGMAEQRAFLLHRSHADAVLYLDDDVWLEPGALQTMHTALHELGCGFVGMAVQGLSFLGEERPDEQEPFAVWNGAVSPERVRRDTPEHDRWRLHNAANLTHIARHVEFPETGWLPYRVAWVGGCVMFRLSALTAVGGFDFWTRLPASHVGEDVVAQWRVMERFGGAGILPSGAVHLESPTTLDDRRIDAPDVILGPAQDAPPRRATA